MATTQIPVPQAEIAEYCRRAGIHKLSLFGSVLTSRFSDASDVDFLVEFEPDQQVGYLRLTAMERELSAIFGRKVDLRTPDELSRYFRDDVMKAARVQYDGDW
ncbi:MAG: nucleotidyltransferase domain-containing protein [Acidobacteriia bacterium]|nr:nucleotidyltransferase domain-containing protein [Terriglobia bacterium]